MRPGADPGRPAPGPTPRVAAPFASRRPVIDVLRAEGLPPSMADHADRLERLRADTSRRACTWARLTTGIALSPPER